MLKRSPARSSALPGARVALDLRRLRLFTGLVLATFLVTHFANHALGLVSLATMQKVLGWFRLLWGNPLGQALLYGSLLTHFLLALRALLARRTLRMGWRETLQLVLGFLLPLQLAGHILSTRVAYRVFGADVDYRTVLWDIWTVAPENGARQALLLVAAWTHACIGLWFWLRPRRWFSAALPWLFAVALLLPVLALLGFAQAGREVALLGPPPPTGSPKAELAHWYMMFVVVFAALVGGVLLLRPLRDWRIGERRIRVTYPGGRHVSVPQGYTVLEASRLARVPHAAICGGRGRCSTCRVWVLEGLDDLPEPAQQESLTLQRIKAPGDIRLACQLRPTHSLSVAPVLTAGEAMLAAPRSSSDLASRERDVAVLFCDLRGFTRLAERRLPFDTVFILNRYFEAVGGAVEKAGGHLDKFIGDGALALFGLNVPPDEAARQAIAAALEIAAALDRVNLALGNELGEPLRIAMGLHVGPAIIGEMGYGLASSLTAVGDTINTASRLEGIAKAENAELVVSHSLLTLAGIPLADASRREFEVRGRSGMLEAWVSLRLPRNDAGAN